MNSCDNDYLSNFDNIRFVENLKIKKVIYSKTFTINEQIEQVKQNVPIERQESFMKYFILLKLLYQNN